MKHIALWTLAVFLLVPLQSGAMAASGKALYDKYCNGCHKSISNKSFKGEGVSKLTKAVISGAGGKMKPRAGTKLSDDEIKAAVQYLISK